MYTFKSAVISPFESERFSEESDKPPVDGARCRSRAALLIYSEWLQVKNNEKERKGSERFYRVQGT